MSYVTPDLKQVEERLFSFFDNVPYDPGNFFYDYRANVAALRELSMADDPQSHIDQFSNIVAAIVSSKDEIRERLAIKYSQFVEEPDGNTYIVPCTRKLAEDELGIAWGNIELEMLVYKDTLDKVKRYSSIKRRSDIEPSHPGVVSPCSDASEAIQVCPIETSTEQHSSEDEWGCKLPDEALMRIYDELLVGGKHFVNRGMTPTEYVDWARDFDTSLWLGCDAAGAILVMEKLAP